MSILEARPRLFSAPYGDPGILLVGDLLADAGPVDGDERDHRRVPRPGSAAFAACPTDERQDAILRWTGGKARY